ncbi:hypothetical protein K466DRAFT_69525 [Polyporus arcularius HHB13444]|uniref:Uncharacterized protein n=1 Tax=Polyporus arcularius HHB13444 TaxID=1314778 RepID=A0A5C3PGS8_9APHY|nr:hypothetical protein K466DRAFT_69525 [Polyporus arcularius HHB13444]
MKNRRAVPGWKERTLIRLLPAWPSMACCLGLSCPWLAPIAQVKAHVFNLQTLPDPDLPNVRTSTVRPDVPILEHFRAPCVQSAT